MTEQATYHRITFISNIDGKASTKKYPTLEKARNDWGGAMHSRFVRYAIWVECRVGFSDAIVKVHGEVLPKAA